MKEGHWKKLSAKPWKNWDCDSLGGERVEKTPWTVRLEGAITDESVVPVIEKILLWHGEYQEHIHDLSNAMDALAERLEDEPQLRDMALEAMAEYIHDIGPFITLLISSPGGDPEPALALVDVMRSILPPIKVIACGKVYSAAVPIVAAGSPGMRLATPSTRFYLHPMRLSPSADLQVEENAAFVEESKKLTELYIERLAKLCKKRKATIRKWITSYTWMSTKQAIQNGIIDEVLS